MAPLRPKLLQHAYGLTDGNTAEDLVQDTLLRLWQMGDSLNSHANKEALALTILRNKWNDHWRRQQRFVNDEELLRRQVASGNPYDDQELIQLIVDSLPPLQQQIFRMKEVEGYEKEEIMLVTGCSDDSLRQNLSRARRRIRELFIKMTNR